MKDTTVEKIIADLINELANRGVISKYELIYQMGPSEVVVLRKKRRYDYYEIAKMLAKKPVFIPIDRKRAQYAQKKLSELLGAHVKKRRAFMSYKKGYLFFL